MTRSRGTCRRLLARPACRVPCLQARRHHFAAQGKTAAAPTGTEGRGALRVRPPAGRAHGTAQCGVCSCAPRRVRRAAVAHRQQAAPAGHPAMRRPARAGRATGSPPVHGGPADRAATGHGRGRQRAAQWATHWGPGPMPAQAAMMKRPAARHGPGPVRPRAPPGAAAPAWAPPPGPATATPRPPRGARQRSAGAGDEGARGSRQGKTGKGSRQRLQRQKPWIISPAPHPPRGSKARRGHWGAR